MINHAQQRRGRTIGRTRRLSGDGRGAAAETNIAAWIGGFGLPVVQLQAAHVEHPAQFMGTMNLAEVGGIGIAPFVTPYGSPRVEEADVREAETPDIGSAAVARVVRILFAAIGSGDLPDVETYVLVDVRDTHELVHPGVAEDTVEDERRRQGIVEATGGELSRGFSLAGGA